MFSQLSSQIKKWFTLIEVLISLVIISLLVGIIFGIYTNIIRLSVRIEQEKDLNNELLFASQTIQNLVDTYDLDLWAYFGTGKSLDIDAEGYTDTLALKTADKAITLHKVGECGVGSGCFLGLESDGTTKQITSPYKVSIPVLKFRILPYQFDQTKDIYQKGFWIYGSITSSKYRTGTYEFNVSQDIQLFFNVRKY